jgi:pimeloyl-ACP methyl ester carboxylesterase
MSSPPSLSHTHTYTHDKTKTTSLGGFLAARYAELHPQRVEKLVLMCPGFDRCSRWESLFGPEALREWEARGYREFEVGGSVRGRGIRGAGAGGVCMYIRTDTLYALPHVTFMCVCVCICAPRILLYTTQHHIHTHTLSHSSKASPSTCPTPS